MSQPKKTCRYHCRTCGSHFTSLAAFDAHGPRNASGGGCLWPDDAPLNPIPGGECRIGSARVVADATLYEHKSADRVRQAFRSAA